MIRTLLVHDPKLAKSLEIALNLEKIDSENSFEIYKKWGWIVFFGDNMLAMKNCALQDFAADSIFICHLGRSVDTEHEVWDIIFPNVFFECDETICKKEVSEKNQNDFIKNPKFLEIFDTQKDYFVEDFGLSVGGIAVSNTPNQSEINESLMLAYSGDVYFDFDISQTIDCIQDEKNPANFLAGVLDGKKPSGLKDAYTRLASNIITSIKLLTEEEK